MNKMFNIVALVSLLLANKQALADNNKVIFILDFLKANTQPTNLINWHTDCWDDEQKVKLIKDAPVASMFAEQDSLNESDFRENPQHCLFTVDLTCNGSSPEKIIQRVNIAINIIIIC